LKRHTGFGLALALAAFVALLLSTPILLGDCYATGQEDLIHSCLQSKRQGIEVYAAVALTAGAASIWLHRRRFGIPAFFALIGLMFAPVLVSTMLNL